MVANHPIRHARTLVRVRFGRYLLEVGNDVRRSPAVAVALDDALAERVGSSASPSTLRIWENGRALVFPRSRLRGRTSGSMIDWYGRAWQVCGRGSGGTAVAHGPGTMNVSMVLPRRGLFQPSIDDGYQLWIAILDLALGRRYGVRVKIGRVIGAFCEGSYDAMIEGRKLAGTAQARRCGSILIHGTILVNVDRVEYCRLINAAERLVDGSGSTQLCSPDRLISLHEIVGRAIVLEELAEALARAAASAGEPIDAFGSLKPAAAEVPNG